MARKNRLASSFFLHVLVGTIAGSIFGVAINTMFISTSTSLFEGRVTLFRLPDENVDYAARDYLSLAIARPDFIENFAAKHGIDAATQVLLSNNLKVVARDASSPNAELRLIGTDEAWIITTLNALAIHVTEVLRTIDRSAMESILSALDKEIALARERNFELINSQRNRSEIPPKLEDDIRTSSELVAARKALELSLRYTLKPPSTPKKHEIEKQIGRLDELIKQRSQRPKTYAGIYGDSFNLATSLAHSSAILKTLRQAKQRVVIEFNQDTPLRVAGGAKVTRLEAEPIPFGRVIGICAFVGALIAGFIWSMRQSKNSKLTGLIIEGRLGRPVVAVIAQRITDFGNNHGTPLAHRQPQDEDLAGIRSLHVAARVLKQRQDRPLQVAFSEIGDGGHIHSVIANLAFDMAYTGMQVLVIDAAGTGRQLPEIFERGEVDGWCVSLAIESLNNNGKLKREASNSKINFIRANINEVSVDKMMHFDGVLIHAPRDSEVKQSLLNLEHCLWLVLCTAETRVSVLRRALGTKMHGVVLCGYST